MVVQMKRRSSKMKLNINTVVCIIPAVSHPGTEAGKERKEKQRVGWVREPWRDPSHSENILCGPLESLPHQKTGCLPTSVDQKATYLVISQYPQEGHSLIGAEVLSLFSCIIHCVVGPERENQLIMTEWNQSEFHHFPLMSWGPLSHIGNFNLTFWPSVCLCIKIRWIRKKMFPLFPGQPWNWELLCCLYRVITFLQNHLCVSVFSDNLIKQAIVLELFLNKRQTLPCFFLSCTKILKHS